MGHNRDASYLFDAVPMYCSHADYGTEAWLEHGNFSHAKNMTVKHFLNIFSTCKNIKGAGGYCLCYLSTDMIVYVWQ